MMGAHEPVRRRISTRVTGIVLFSLAAVSADADIVNLVPIQDTTLYEDTISSSANGAGSAMFAGRNSQSVNSIRRAMLMFDIAGAIPSGSMIQSASLRLINDAANSATQTVELRRINRAWGEGNSLAAGGQGSGAPPAPGDATWLHTYYNSDFWTQPGGDFKGTASASAAVGGVGEYTWSATAALIADVQGFLNQPQTNYGWVVLGDEGAPSTAKRFATREAADLAIRPALTITYTPIPEPSSFFAVIFGAMWTLRGKHSTRHD